MNLRPATDADIATLMSWFSDQLNTRMWGGPHFRYPFDDASFRADCRFGQMPGYSLAADDALLGFGQYYDRFGRCHLARIVVAPDHRGEGLVRPLIGGIASIAACTGSFAEASLYVMPRNRVARRCYRQLGFADARHPDGSQPPEDCLYMVAPLDALTA